MRRGLFLMDLNDLEKEIMKIRKKNHDISNLLAIQSAHFDELSNIKSDISSIKNSLEDVLTSLSGGLRGSGIINRVELLEDKHKKLSKWIGYIAATILAMFIRQAYSSFFTLDKYRADNPIVRSENEIKIEAKKEDKKS
jgi:hypothetical protein